jgi:hypothetical protein
LQDRGFQVRTCPESNDSIINISVARKFARRVYSVPGFLIIPGERSDARFVGDRPGTEMRWQANRHLWFPADCGIFYAGKFVKESKPGRNLNYWALWAGYKF